MLCLSILDPHYILHYIHNSQRNSLWWKVSTKERKDEKLGCYSFKSTPPPTGSLTSSARTFCIIYAEVKPKTKQKQNRTFPSFIA